MKTLLTLLLLTLSCYAQVSLKLIDKLPYDNQIFTQGLSFHNGNLYISGGLYEQSALYKYELATKNLQRIVTLPANQFAEGITVTNDKIYQLTWKSGMGYVYDLQSYNEIESFSYTKEGWGITNSGDDFYLSDGSEYIKKFGYSKNLNFSPILVADKERAYGNLNELEFIEGLIFANVWQTDFIVVIEPTTGEVLHKIYPTEHIPTKELKGCGVLNGIAYDRENKLLYITGKNWYEIYVFEMVIK